MIEPLIRQHDQRDGNRHFLGVQSAQEESQEDHCLTWSQEAVAITNAEIVHESGQVKEAAQYVEDECGIVVQVGYSHVITDRQRGKQRRSLTAPQQIGESDRKSTRLNSSHLGIS